MATASYLVGLGSNRRGRHGSPEAEVRAAAAKLGRVRRLSPILQSAPVGPSRRRYANAAAWVETSLSPSALLAHAKALERAAGRRAGQRWGARVLDIDLLFWSGGCWSGPGLTIPHPLLRTRQFVLDPLCAIAPQWRDPVSGRTVRQLAHRCRRAIPVDRRAACA